MRKINIMCFISLLLSLTLKAQLSSPLPFMSKFTPHSAIVTIPWRIAVFSIEFRMHFCPYTLKNTLNLFIHKHLKMSARVIKSSLS